MLNMQEVMVAFLSVGLHRGQCLMEEARLLDEVLNGPHMQIISGRWKEMLGTLPDIQPDLPTKSLPSLLA